MKKTLIVLSLVLLIFTFYQIKTSFGLFETKIDNDNELAIAKWHIYVNDNDLTGKEETFTVTDITYSNNSGVSEGYFAPGTTGSFLLIIDPKDTEVSFIYELAITLDKYPNIKIDSIEGVNGTVLTLDNGKYKRLMTLKEIQGGKKDTIKVTFSWQDDEKYNDLDSRIGSSVEEIEIPISIKFSQYNE